VEALTLLLRVREVKRCARANVVNMPFAMVFPGHAVSEQARQVIHQVRNSATDQLSKRCTLAAPVKPNHFPNPCPAGVRDSELRVELVVGSRPAHAMNLLIAFSMFARGSSPTSSKLRAFLHFAVLVFPHFSSARVQWVCSIGSVVVSQADGALPRRGEAFFRVPMLTGLASEVVSEPLCLGLGSGNDVHGCSW
jgi:hypothetical protein